MCYLNYVYTVEELFHMRTSVAVFIGSPHSGYCPLQGITGSDNNVPDIWKKLQCEIIEVSAGVLTIADTARW